MIISLRTLICQATCFSSPVREFAGADVWVPWVIPKRYYLDNAETKEEVPQSGGGEHKQSANCSAEEKKLAIPLETTVQRYCHVYEQGELEELFLSLNNCEIVRSFFDSGNHCVEVRRLK